MAFRQSRLSDVDVIRAIRHNENLRGPDSDTEVDVFALFPTPTKRRHSWEVKQRDKKMFRTGTLSVCRDCGMERDQCLDFGHWRTRFRIAGAWVETKTPPCGQTSNA
jgi:hypothetical protein